MEESRQSTAMAVDCGGAARRRRQRRLRQFLRHERLGVAMALADSPHHIAQRQKTARASEGGGGARDELHGRAPDDATSPPPALPLPPKRLVPGTLR